MQNNNSNLNLVSEKYVEELVLKRHQENIKSLQEKEKYINSLPYSDEYPRIYSNKYNTCENLFIRSIYMSTIMSSLLTVPYTMVRYSKFIQKIN